METPTNINQLRAYIKLLQKNLDEREAEIKSSRFRLDEQLKKLEILEADLICSSCKKPMEKEDPYIADGAYTYCSLDCKSTGQVAEQKGIDALEAKRQGGTV